MVSCNNLAAIAAIAASCCFASGSINPEEDARTGDVAGIELERELVQMYGKRGGMRRSMLKPGEKGRGGVVDYGGAHPFESKRRRRDLQSESSSDQFKPIRIHFKWSSLETWAYHPRYRDKIRYLKEDVLPSMAELWSAALRVVPVVGSVEVDYTWCPFADSYEAVFTDGVYGTDLVVFVTANSEICSDSATLASAYACYWDQYQRPIAGNIDFCLDALKLGDNDQQLSSTASRTRDNEAVRDAELQRRLDSTIGTAVHEFGHVLGVHSSDFVFFYDWSTGLPRTPNPTKRNVQCVDDTTQTIWLPGADTISTGGIKNGNVFYQVTTPTVKQVVQNHFNCQSLAGASLENQNTLGDCFGSHWEERLYFTEMMSPVLTDISEYLSPLTLALLYDSGWYRPNFNMAKISPFGHAAGCDFVTNKCIESGSVPPHSQGYFCNSPYSPKDTEVSYGCDPTHTHMAICDLVDYSKFPQYQPPPRDFQYFELSTLGSIMKTADYCPTYSLQALPCHNLPNYHKNAKYFPNLTYPLESYSSNSRCYVTNETRPVCLDTLCDETNHVVIAILGDQRIVCDYDGQIHILPDSNITITCPRLATVCPDLICPANCAGKGICDYSRKDPECICFDKDDTSPSCTDSIKIIPPKRAWSGAGAASRTMSLCFVMISCVALFAISSRTF